MGGTGFLELIDGGASLVVGTVEQRRSAARRPGVGEPDRRAGAAAHPARDGARRRGDGGQRRTGGDRRRHRSRRPHVAVRPAEGLRAVGRATGAGRPGAGRRAQPAVHRRRDRRRRARRPTCSGGCCRTRSCASSWRSTTGSTRRRARRPGGRGRTAGDRRPHSALDVLERCFSGAIPCVLATSSAAGVPNVTFLSKAHRVDHERIALSNQFMSKTTRNLASNPLASLLVVDPVTGAGVPAGAGVRADRATRARVRAAAHRRRRRRRAHGDAGRLPAAGGDDLPRPSRSPR